MNSEVDALRREGEQYLKVGMLDRVALVNEQITLRGGEVIALPKESRSQTRQSAKADTRKKAVKKSGE